eukprot:CAMPEP_0201627118 /NCGR_PEP_ID=MMETSP0493-20130528/2313_1 /ASSEMBLY_ACC=CAM_ASM_000838 /TAXON_ID=420259 /ORGANISM="Thalassiosira gravida, Strain GMp14c1" /LENGTH=52 /DNA_ID=CAMNT_0048097395 /DNA_START=194 /DNA_END=352 /DNA_ORIENTATION=-
MTSRLVEMFRLELEQDDNLPNVRFTEVAINLIMLLMPLLSPTGTAAGVLLFS